MNVHPVKSCLRNIVLLAKEYKEITNGREREDINRIKNAVCNGGQISRYDKDFLGTVNGAKRNVLAQIDFFTKKLVCEFALPDELVINIDPLKVKFAMVNLSNYERNLLISILKFQVLQQHLEKDKKGKYRAVSIEEILPELDRFADCASIDQ